MTERKVESSDVLTRSISHEARKYNSIWVDRVRPTSHALRFEDDRPSDLPLVTVALRKRPLPDNYTKISEGVYLIDAPADVPRTLWLTDGGFAVATYRTRDDRDADL